jgi:hypothetical protein
MARALMVARMGYGAMQMVPVRLPFARRPVAAVLLAGRQYPGQSLAMGRSLFYAYNHEWSFTG